MRGFHALKTNNNPAQAGMTIAANRLSPELRRILKAIRHSQGFRLMFAEFNHFGRREQLIKQINQQLESSSTVHQLNQVPYHLQDWLEQDVAPLAQQHRLIHILTPEFNRDNQAALEQFFLHLNYMLSLIHI